MPSRVAKCYDFSARSTDTAGKEKMLPLLLMACNDSSVRGMRNWDRLPWISVDRDLISLRAAQYALSKCCQVNVATRMHRVHVKNQVSYSMRSTIKVLRASHLVALGKAAGYPGEGPEDIGSIGMHHRCTEVSNTEKLATATSFSQKGCAQGHAPEDEKQKDHDQPSLQFQIKITPAVGRLYDLVSDKHAPEVL